MRRCRLWGGDTSGPLVVVAVVAVIVIALIVLLSAIWVIIAFGLKRMATMHSAYAARLYAQCQERTDETYVLGRDELIGPRQQADLIPHMT